MGRLMQLRIPVKWQLRIDMMADRKLMAFKQRFVLR
jgi:hypothetical protein